MSNPVLVAHNITKSYYSPLKTRGKRNISAHPLPILKGVSLSVEEKETVSIIGNSGSGKTTFLNILGCLDTPDNGNLEYEGNSLLKSGKYQLSDKALSKFRNEKIGFIFQFHHLLEDFNALENIAMPCFLKTNNIHLAKEKSYQLLKKLDLENRSDHLPSQLSGGEQQRVAVARSMINAPALILADEPTGNLDSRTSEELYNIIKALAEEEQTSFVIVTHNQAYANYTNKMFEMKDGILH